MSPATSAALRKAGQINPIPLMTNNVDHSLWLRRGLVTWSLVLCNTVFCCRIFLSELWESGGTGPQRGRAASTKLIINVSSGLLGEAAEPQGQCEKWQIKGSTVWLFLCSSQVSSPLASKLTDISFHKACQMSNEATTGQILLPYHWRQRNRWKRG